MAQAVDMHPITRACMGFHLWSLAGLEQQGDGVEATVTGAVFAPLAMGGGRALRAGGSPATRLDRWLEGMNSACMAATRHLDDIDAWALRAETAMAGLSGRTPLALRGVFVEWPLVSAPMAEAMTGVSRAAVQRNLNWMESHGLIREVTGQGRFRMWRIA
jgi:hypothetical protein